MADLLNVTHVVLALDVGGLERNVVNQVQEAQNLGQRVSVVCLEGPGALAPKAEATRVFAPHSWSRKSPSPSCCSQARSSCSAVLKRCGRWISAISRSMSPQLRIRCRKNSTRNSRRWMSSTESC